MDSYDDIYSKVALALTSAQVAKQGVVDDAGIGEDIPFTFMGWDGPRLAVLMSLGPETMSKPVLERMPLVAAVSEIMRKVYCVDSITFVAEGYISKSVLNVRWRDLRKDFANNDKDVSECINVVQIGFDSFGHPYASLMAAAYSYGKGREVTWNSVNYYEHGVGKVMKDSPIVAMIALALKDEAIGVEPEQYMAALDAISGDGVQIHEFQEPPLLGETDDL